MEKEGRDERLQLFVFGEEDIVRSDPADPAVAKNNEVVILDEKVIPLTQQEIATTLKCSKMKINSMFSILQKQDYIEQKTRGKYVLTDKAENIIETIETLP